jgi:hypothetical protein
MRLSGPHSRPSTTQKRIGRIGGRKGNKGSWRLEGLEEVESKKENVQSNRGAVKYDERKGGKGICKRSKR